MRFEWKVAEAFQPHSPLPFPPPLPVGAARELMRCSTALHRNIIQVLSLFSVVQRDPVLVQVLSPISSPSSDHQYAADAGGIHHDLAPVWLHLYARLIANNDPAHPNLLNTPELRILVITPARQRHITSNPLSCEPALAV